MPKIEVLEFVSPFQMYLVQKVNFAGTLAGNRCGVLTFFPLRFTVPPFVKAVDSSHITCANRHFPCQFGKTVTFL